MNCVFSRTSRLICTKTPLERGEFRFCAVAIVKNKLFIFSSIRILRVIFVYRFVDN